MPKRQKMRVFDPPKPRVPDALAIETSKKAGEFIASELKPQYVKSAPSPEEYDTYIVDIYAKWHTRYFYFIAKYHSVSPHAIKPDFEIKFARLEFVGDNRFTVSYMRHTNQWWEVYPELTLEQCFEAIQEDPFFAP